LKRTKQSQEEDAEERKHLKQRIRELETEREKLRDTVFSKRQTSELEVEEQKEVAQLIERLREKGEEVCNSFHLSLPKQ